MNNQMIYLVFISFVCISPMGWFGYRDGRSGQFTFGALIVRSLTWSFVAGWSLVIIGGGHGVGFLPLPWWLAILARIGFGRNFVVSLPPYWLGPLPSMLFFLLVAYFAPRKKIKRAP